MNQRKRTTEARAGATAVWMTSTGKKKKQQRQKKLQGMAQRELDAAKKKLRTIRGGVNVSAADPTSAVWVSGGKVRIPEAFGGKVVSERRKASLRKGAKVGREWDQAERSRAATPGAPGERLSGRSGSMARFFPSAEQDLGGGHGMMSGPKGGRVPKEGTVRGDRRDGEPDDQPSVPGESPGPGDDDDE